MSLYAMVTEQGTAAAETGLCDTHYEEYKEKVSKEARDDVKPDSWRDVTGNEEIYCNICGYPDAPSYQCTNCGWEGYESDLTFIGEDLDTPICPKCKSKDVTTIY